MKSDSMQPNSVTVCIVTYKRDAKLLESLARLQDSTLRPSQVLIVDNGSSADLPQRLANVPLPVELIYPQSNVGCAGLNLAFAKVTSTFVVCLDDDSYPAADCLEQVVRLFSNDSELGMIGFKMHVPETGEAWHDELWNPETDEPRDTAYCSGCGLAFRSDARLPYELCLNAIVSQQHELSMAAEFLRLGYRVQFRPECIAYHPETGGEHFPKEKFEMVKRNQMIFMGTYLPDDSRRIIILSYLLFIVAHRIWNARIPLTLFLKAKRRPLSRQHIAAFSETIMLHTHAWLRGRMAQTLGLV